MAENEQTKICPKCGKQMEEGYILECAFPRGLDVSKWVAGTPDWGGTFFGLKFRPLNITRRANLQIRTFRCKQCGFLESYAT
ncbi:MAG: PF20097 family protein [Verrucomicrobiota bacterium]|jgi:predicted RNA-binding Zn-ribbon protein involved in translation (DUF1610 family)